MTTHFNLHCPALLPPLHANVLCRLTDLQLRYFVLVPYVHQLRLPLYALLPSINRAPLVSLHLTTFPSSLWRTDDIQKGLRPKRSIRGAMAHDISMYAIVQKEGCAAILLCHGVRPLCLRARLLPRAALAWTRRLRRPSLAWRATRSRPICSWCPRRKNAALELRTPQKIA